MMATVGFHRLNLIQIGRNDEGKRKYLNLVVPQEDLDKVLQCVLHALGMALDRTPPERDI